MYCTNCGCKLQDNASFCTGCGGKVEGQPTPVEVVRDTKKGLGAIEIPPKLIVPAIILGVVISFLAISGLGHLIDADDHQTQAQSPSSTMASPVLAAKPPVTDQFVHPYELLKNPYLHQGQIVVLDTTSWPTVFNGQVIQYAAPESPTTVRLGFTALQFERMSASDTALYKIMYDDADNRSGELDTAGELAVISASSDPPDISRGGWDVEPRGAVEGKNRFGGPVVLPVVKFWGYTNQRGARH